MRRSRPRACWARSTSASGPGGSETYLADGGRDRIHAVGAGAREPGQQAVLADRAARADSDDGGEVSDDGCVASVAGSDAAAAGGCGWQRRCAAGGAAAAPSRQSATVGQLIETAAAGDAAADWMRTAPSIARTRPRSTQLVDRDVCCRTSIRSTRRGWCWAGTGLRPAPEQRAALRRRPSTTRCCATTAPRWWNSPAIASRCCRTRASRPTRPSATVRTQVRKNDGTHGGGELQPAPHATRAGRPGTSSSRASAT